MPAGNQERRHDVNRPFAYGDKVLLLDNKQRRYLITLSPRQAEFHTHAGCVARTPTSSGQAEGVVMRSTKGAAVHGAAPDARGLRPRDAPRRPGDLPEGPRPDLHAGRHRPRCAVLESGVGSGALSMTMLRWGAEIVGYELREDFANRARQRRAVPR
jgi:tRNA (adenine57-N1/adenine58-N1)-methyltransferase